MSARRTGLRTACAITIGQSSPYPPDEPPNNVFDLNVLVDRGRCEFNRMHTPVEFWPALTARTPTRAKWRPGLAPWLEMRRQRPTEEGLDRFLNVFRFLLCECVGHATCSYRCQRVCAPALLSALIVSGAEPPLHTFKGGVLPPAGQCW